MKFEPLIHCTGRDDRGETCSVKVERGQLCHFCKKRAFPMGVVGAREAPENARELAATHQPFQPEETK